MIRKLGLALLCATNIFASNLYAATEHLFNQASTYEFLLPANEPQIFTNTFFWTIESKCVIISDQEENPFSFTVLRKTGSLNGVPLAQGNSVDIVVHPGELLYITAASGGRVELLNRGENLVKASCSAA